MTRPICSMPVKNNLIPRTRKGLKGLNSLAQGDALGFDYEYNLNPEGVGPYRRFGSWKREYNPFRVSVVCQLLTETQGVALG